MPEIMNKIKNKIFGQKPQPLTKSRICSILDLPAPEKDETYTKLGFAHDVQPGGVAILSVNTSAPIKTSEARCVELADLAMSRGAALLLSPFQVKDYPCLIVEDVFTAFCEIATDIRNDFNPRTISITGSIGKTTTTQMVYSVLSTKYNTHRNDSSANNARLAAAVIQRLRPEHEVYVQETMEGPPYGVASIISKMVQPDAAIITMVGSSHLEYFGTQERILESCLGVQDGMPEDGLLILNGDDPFQRDAKCSRRAVYYGIEYEQADYRAVNITGEGNSLTFDVLHDGKSTPVRIRCFGRHNVLNALAAFAAGKWAGMEDEEIVSGLDKFRTKGIRQNYVRVGGKNLFLDCYNAAPESMGSAFESLSMIPKEKKGRRIAVLADIKECGEKEREYHLAVGKMVTEAAIDHLVCYGKNARLIASVALAESNIPVYHTEKQSELVEYLQKTVTSQDVVLFKGSHSMALEQAVDKAFGTWYHEEFEEYEFKMKRTSDENFKYRVYTDHVTVVQKISSEKELVIPAYVNKLPVTGLGQSLFNQSKYTQSVELPETLVNIRYCAFYKANHIRSIRIPASVRIIGESAFHGCANLREVVIEEGCTHIGYRAFCTCPQLIKVVIPASVQRIENEVFLNSTNVVICGVKGSYAERYAASRKIPFAAL